MTLHEFNQPDIYATSNQIKRLADTALLAVARYGTPLPEDTVFKLKDGIPILPIERAGSFASTLSLCPELIASHTPHAYRQLLPTEGLIVAVWPANYRGSNNDFSSFEFVPVKLDLVVEQSLIETTYTLASSAENILESVSDPKWETDVSVFDEQTAFHNHMDDAHKSRVQMTCSDAEAFSELFLNIEALI